MGQSGECNLKVGNLCLDNSHLRDICQSIIDDSDHLRGSALNPYAKQNGSSEVALTCFSKCEDGAYHIIEADISEPWLASIFKRFEHQDNKKELSINNIEISYLTDNAYVQKVHDLFGPKAFLPEIKQAGVGIGIGLLVVGTVLLFVACSDENPEPRMYQPDVTMLDIPTPHLPDDNHTGPDTIEGSDTEDDTTPSVDTTEDSSDSTGADIQTYPDISEPNDATAIPTDILPEVSTDTTQTDTVFQDTYFDLSDTTEFDISEDIIEDSSEEITGDTTPTDIAAEETSDSVTTDTETDTTPIEESENFCFDPFEPGSCMTSGNVSQEIKDAMSLCPTVAKVTIDGEEMSLADALALDSGNPFLLSSSDISIQFYFDNIHPNDINDEDEFILTANPIMFEDNAFGEWIGMMGGIEYFTMWSLDDDTLILNKSIPTSSTTACSMSWYFPCESEFVCE